MLFFLSGLAMLRSIYALAFQLSLLIQEIDNCHVIYEEMRMLLINRT